MIRRKVKPISLKSLGSRVSSRNFHSRVSNARTILGSASSTCVCPFALSHS